MRKIILVLISMLFIFSLIGCNKKDLPNISQDEINATQNEMNKNKEVSDSYIEVKENTIIFAITVKESNLSEEKAKDLADTFTRLLSSQVANNNKDMNMPNKDNLGGIYEYYDINVGIGTSSDNIMYQGSKVAGAEKITW